MLFVVFDFIVTDPRRFGASCKAGVCQRDCTSYYGFLVEEADRLSGLLEEFFATEVCKKFPDPDCELFQQRGGSRFHADNMRHKHQGTHV